MLLLQARQPRNKDWTKITTECLPEVLATWPEMINYRRDEQKNRTFEVAIYQCD